MTIGLVQSGTNLLIIFLFAVSWYLRRDDPSDPTAGALLLSWIGIMLSPFSGWLVGELVERPGGGFEGLPLSDNDDHISYPHATR